MTWANLSESDTLTQLRAELRANGYNHNGYPSRLWNYVAILSVNSGGSCGIAYQNQPGNIWAYGVVFRQCLAQNGQVDTLRFGCATFGDKAVMHETTHILGAGHVGNINDLMCGAPTTGCQRGMNTSPRMELDHGANDYRQAAFNRGWAVSTYFKQSTPYNICT